MASRALIAISIVSIVLAIALAFGVNFSFQLAGIRVRGADPMRPLLIAAAIAWCASAVSRAGPARWFALGLGAFASLLVVVLTFVRASVPQYAVGDAAFLELYTLHAVRGVWPFGPYSRFGWHHPGPLYFYLLAPLYAAGGLRYAALNAGAGLINLGSLVFLLYLVGRCGSVASVFWIPVALGAYVLELAPAFVSAWNPHVLPLPTGALVVVSAALANGRLWLGPVSVALGSFCMQTHVGLGPCVVALWAFGSVGVALRVWRGEIQSEAARRWLNLSMWIAVVCWLLPIAEELNNYPGNLTAILRFFFGSERGRPFPEAFRIWADTMSALVTNRLAIPRGHAVLSTGSVLPIALAVGQMLALTVVVARPRGNDAFERSLAAAGLLSAGVALWSASRISVPIGDYHVFWMSIIGALNWATLAAAATSGLCRRLFRVPAPRLAFVIHPVLIAGLVYASSQSLRTTQRRGGSRSRVAGQIKAAADAIGGDMRDRGYPRVVVHGGSGAWGEVGGVVLELYKRNVAVAVDSGSAFLFGKPLVATGNEVAEYFVHRTKAHSASQDLPGSEVIMRRSAVTVTRRACEASVTSGPCLARR